MSNFALIHGGIGSGGWPGGYVVTTLDFQTLDEHQSKTINATDGSTHAPSSTITIGGAGFTLAGANHHVTGTLHIDSAGKVSVSSSGTLEALAGSTTTIAGPATFSDAVDISPTATLTVECAATFLATTFIGGSGALNFSSGSQILGSPVVNGTLAINGATSVTATMTMGAASHLAFTAGADITGTAALKGVLALGTGGRIRWRRIGGVDADHTYSIADADIVQIPTLSGNRTYTVQPTGAADGDRMLYTMSSDAVSATANAVTLIRSEDSTQIGTPLKKGVSGFRASMWLVFDGTRWQPGDACFTP